MTDYDLYLPAVPTQKDWPRLYRQYVEANERLLDAVARIDAPDATLDPDLSGAHDDAGRALVRCPASELIHVAQKVRVAQNLTDINRAFPNLSYLIEADIFRLLGIPEPNQPLLPTLHTTG
tara:strand:+ start:1853 stop:2215 length:363 start_codon:yes stop_codon:yes gene_type:complete